MATHSSVLAWRIPRTGEPGGLPSLGSHRVRHDWNNLVAAEATRLSFQSLSHFWLFEHHRLQHARLPCPSTTPGACSNSYPSSQWCRLTISSSVIPFSSCLQLFPESGSFPKSQFYTSGGESFRVSASASVLPMDIQDWFPLGWTSWIFLQSKGLSRVFSNTKAQKHQYYGTQLSL